MICASLRPILIAAGVALAAPLAACSSGGTVVSGVDISPNYQPSELRRYGSGGNELRVETHGDPFGAGPARTAQATVAAMQGNTFGNPVDFAVDPQAEDNPPSRVVVYFNPRQMVGGETLCAPRTPVTTDPASGGPLRAKAAWCQSNYAITSANARADVGSLDSPAFESLISQLTIALFPPNNPHQGDDTRIVPFVTP